MKKYYASIIFLFCCFTFPSIVKAQVYVKADAAGLDDGTSWADAYTDLQTALDATSSGEIWVANGVYKPITTVGDTTAQFSVSSNVSLYGGFVGTETTLGERDLTTFSTILSGDIAEDDVDADFSVNKADNLVRVLYIDSTITETVTIDGFKIQGAYTSELFADGFFLNTGGGILSLVTINVANCLFENNYGRAGGSIAVSDRTGGGDNSTFTNCTFTKNRSTSQSAAIFLANNTGSKISNCTFAENQTTRGVIYPLRCTNVEIDNCTFTNNETFLDGAFGGVLFNWNNIGLSITNCVFDGNSGGNGAVMYADGREIESSSDNMIIRDCEFTNNEATGVGGVIRGFSYTFTIEDCNFSDNAANSGGGMYNNGIDTLGTREPTIIRRCTFKDNLVLDFGGAGLYLAGERMIYQIEDCTFEDNEGPNGVHMFLTGSSDTMSVTNCTFDGGAGEFGGAHSCYGLNSQFTLKNNMYTENEVSVSGGALIIGFQASVDMDSCLFDGNVARFGGAISAQNEATFYIATNCTFTDNTANTGGDENNTANGGAVNAGGEGNTFINCLFADNNAKSFGGAITSTEGTAATEYFLRLENCELSNNSAGLQGGGISVVDVDADLVNVLLNSNLNFGVDGAGGAISNNSTDSNSVAMTLVNCTLFGNLADVGAGIAQFTGDTASMASLTLQNTILQNDGSNYDVEAGAPSIFSNGGNISTDATMTTLLTEPTDQHESGDVKFVDPDDNNLQLTSESQAIDAGVEMGAPLLDLLGNPRVREVDAGAYEFQGSVATKDIVIDNNGQLSIFPNPAEDQLNIQLDNDWNGNLEVQLVDSNGRLIRQGIVNKFGGQLQQLIPVDDLTAGKYEILIFNEGQVLTQGFIKL